MISVDGPCPYSGDACQRHCPPTACTRDLEDPAVWPDVEPDCMDLGETVTWPMGANE